MIIIEVTVEFTDIIYLCIYVCTLCSSKSEKNLSLLVFFSMYISLLLCAYTKIITLAIGDTVPDRELKRTVTIYIYIVRTRLSL